MAIIGLSSSASGLKALSTELDVIANNLANINTPGFKASRVNFQDLFYIERKQAGVENLNGDQRPIGLYVGLGVETSGTQRDLEKGPAMATGNELDVLIEGNGYFQVEVEDDLSETGIAYTRAGNFTQNSEGEIVLASDVGRRLVGNFVIPNDTVKINIGDDGVIQVLRSGSDEPEDIGQIELAGFVNSGGLKPVGENLFVPTAASGDPIVATPGTDGLGFLKQGFLEGSNVEPVKELVELIRTQRAFELNGQALRASDETLQQINTLRR